MLHKILSVMRNEFISLIHKPKLLLVIASVVFVIDSAAKPMKELSIELGYKLNIAEPFLFITSKGVNIVIIPLIFIAILSDFPSSENTNYFSMIRNGRMAWYWGEVLFSITTSILYIVILFLSTAIYCADNGFVGDYWSDYTLKTYKEYPDVFLYGTMFLDTSVYTQGTPIKILLQALILLILYIFILIQLMLFFKIIGKKSFGIISAIGLTFVGMPSYATTSKIRWLFPVTHTAYNWHFNEFFYEPYCRLSTSYIYFSILIVVFTALNMFLIKRMRIGANYD
ncbi:MAG: hypothetical protein NC320_12710 [Clostridium sp.]|nr:hypothetical protein [Clostridium sp.]